MITRKKVLSLNISLITYDGALQYIVDLGKAKKPSYVCFANVHMTIEAQESKTFATQVNDADLVLPDGMPLVKTLKWFYGTQQERVAGMDAFPDILKLAEQEGLKVFFFGTTNEVLTIIQNKAQKQFPNIQIAGAFSPPFDQSLNSNEYIDMINQSGTNIVFVALGCPKQEKWMAENAHKINALLLGVGGAFPIYADLAKRAPVFMRNVGLEWLYRLAQEPGRLFKRYFKTNTKFMALILVTKLKLLFKKS